MTRFFVPFLDDEPAAIEVNGHKLLIVTSESADMIADLEVLGGAEIREIALADDDSEGSKLMADLAADINGGVVLTPPGVSPRTMIEDLSEELPWIH